MDVALYFIAPHRLRPIDVEFITRLSELVPVVRGSRVTGSQASINYHSLRIALQAASGALLLVRLYALLELAAAP